MEASQSVEEHSHCGGWLKVVEELLALWGAGVWLEPLDGEAWAELGLVASLVLPGVMWGQVGRAEEGVGLFVSLETEGGKQGLKLVQLEVGEGVACGHWSLQVAQEARLCRPGRVAGSRCRHGWAGHGTAQRPDSVS